MQTNYLILHSRKQEKSKLNPKQTEERNIKIRVEKKRNREWEEREKSMKSQVGSSERVTKLDKTLARLTKKRKKTQITTSRNVRGYIYYDQLYQNKRICKYYEQLYA